jgi:hypothetical protein
MEYGRFFGFGSSRLIGAPQAGQWLKVDGM